MPVVHGIMGLTGQRQAMSHQYRQITRYRVKNKMKKEERIFYIKNQRVEECNMMERELSGGAKIPWF